MVVTSADPQLLFNQAREQGPNPFRQKPIVSKDEVWGEVMTDLANLNSHVDQNIHQAISDVRNKYTHKVGIVVKGDVGTGKSHVIHRIRKTIENEIKCIFAYIPPYSHASRINSHVRLYLALSLNERDSNGITQWQKLAAAVIKTLEGTDFETKYKQYIEKCSKPDELRKYIITTHKRNELVEFFDSLVEAILENQPKLDFNFLKAALFLLLKTAPLAQVGLAWMIGEDFPGTKEAGLTEFSPEQHEGKSTWMIQQICGLAEVISSPMLICFDQLDCAPASNDSGDSPAMIVAKCIDQIYFQCSNVILLCCAISTMWTEIVELGGGISERVGERSVSTKPPNAEQMLELVKLRLDWFYRQKNLDPSLYPYLYPLHEGEIKKLALRGTGSRDLMKWCADKFESASESVDSPPKVDPLEKRQKEFLEVYNELLQRRISVPVDDDDKLGSVISNTMRMIPSGGTADVIVTDVKSFDSPSYALHMIISGYDSLHNKKVEIGVRVCQTKTAKTFNAVMKRLVDYEKYQLTRGCLIRSAHVLPSWKVGTQLKQQLERDQAGEVVALKKEEIKPLVVIQRIYEEAGNGSAADSLNGFTKEEVIYFVKELRLVAENPLICEILSAPVST
jgi:tRNA A37 threonylcarbamoyladenosine biosynthesis protein TsaE